MPTETGVDTRTETETLTRTKGACAAGAGALAITCKTMTLGFFAAGATLVGLSGVSPLALMIGVVVLGSAFFWKGFRWAGRRPAFLGIASLLFMFLGYIAAGRFVTSEAVGGSREFLGSVRFGMWPAADVTANAIWLLVPAALYLVGTVLFFGAVYDSYIRKLAVFDSSGAMGAGILGLSVCGGCGLTGVAGAGMVIATGVSTNDMKFLGADALMSLLVVGLVGYTIYKRAWPQTALTVVGSVLAFFLFGGLFGLPADAGFFAIVAGTGLEGMIGETFANVLDAAVTWIGLGSMFLGAMWAAYPDLEVVPRAWRDRVGPSRAA